MQLLLMANIFIFFSILLLSFALHSIQDITVDKSALISFRSAVGGRTLLWDIIQTTPCNWTGVSCNGGRVTAIRLPEEMLTGKIPEGIFGNLTQLRMLSLRLNALTGSLPLDLGSCSDLRGLFLQGNRFSGGILEVFFSLSNLVRLNLAENNFTGKISSAFCLFDKDRMQIKKREDRQ